MFRNYLTVAVRNLRRNRGYAAINLAGLAVGLACCLLIFLYVRHELTYDRYHAESDRIYRLAMTQPGASFGAGLAKVADLWGPGAQEELAAVEKSTRFVFAGRTLVERGGRRQYESDGLYADSLTFEMFSWPLLRGNPKTALRGENKIVLTESFARRWFDDADPIGETLLLDGEQLVTVTGVMLDVPSNSHFRFDFLVSLESYDHPARGDFHSWYQFYTYLLLTPEADTARVLAGIDALLDERMPQDRAAQTIPILQPLPRIHLHSDLHREMAANGDMGYVYVFSAIALFILLIAGTNFVSLATARASNRALEVGVRKVSGADRWALTRQFLTEAVVLALLAMVLAWGLAHLLVEPFNALATKDFTSSDLVDLRLMGWMLLAALIVGLLSGAYPALFLSSFRPIRVLKGDTGTGSRSGLRRGLVVFQFAISAFLIVATGVVYSQLNYIQNKQLGFNREQVVVVGTNSTETRQHFETVKEQMMRHPGVQNVSFSANRPGGSDWGFPVQIEGFEQSQVPGFRSLVVDEDFLRTYEIEVVEGRGFSEEFGRDSSAFLINETAARQLGWTVDSAARIGIDVVDREFGPLIGIVRDFHFRSMHETIAPLLFLMEDDWLTTFNIRIRAENVDETLAHLESVMSRWEPEFPFTYRFFDEQFATLHEAERRLARLLTWFAVLAILIACLGLIGLSAFTADQRKKEVGIRKVLGAGIGRIVVLLSREIVVLVLIGVAIAALPAYLAMKRWLQNFAYQPGIDWSVFAIAALTTLLIAVITVSVQTVKAALRDPVKSLRYE